MRRSRLALFVVLAMSVLAYSGSNAWAQAACAVNLAVHPHARILLHHKTIAQCVSGAAGCKCVSCYGFDGAVYSYCNSLWAPIPH